MAGRPRSDARSTCEPVSTAAGSGGAAGREGWARLVAVSAAIRPAIAPTPTTMSASGRRRTAASLRRQHRHVVDDLLGLEVGWVEGRDVAAGADAVDQGRVRHELGRL